MHCWQFTVLLLLSTLALAAAPAEEPVSLQGFSSGGARAEREWEAKFCAEFFSVFNHAQFGNPDGNINDSAFGFVTGARGERVGQVAVKLYF